MPTIHHLLRRSLRPLLIGLLLFLIWFVVLPYQAAVRIDQALSGWAHTHPDLNLIRQGHSPFLREYQLRWHRPTGETALVLNLTVQTRPTEFWRGDWVWGTLRLAIAPDSPWQVLHWNRQPLHLDGKVSGLGDWQFSLVPPPAFAGFARATATRQARTGDWRVALDWPGLIITTAHSTIWFGRSQWNLREKTAPVDDDENEDAAQETSLQSSLYIRRLGWRLSTGRGQMDHLALQINSLPPTQGHAFSVGAQQIRLSSAPAETPGTFQLSGQCRAAAPAFSPSIWQCLNALAPILAVPTLTSALPEVDIQLSARLSASGNARRWLVRQLPTRPTPTATADWQIEYDHQRGEIIPTPTDHTGDTLDAQPIPPH